MTAGTLIIAVLDDEAPMRTALARLLRAHGFEVAVFDTGEAFLTAQASRHFDCLLLDLHMPGPDGFAVLDRVRSRPSGPPVVVLTGNDHPGTAARVAGLGGRACLAKPVDETVLIETITRHRHRPADDPGPPSR